MGAVLLGVSSLIEHRQKLTFLYQRPHLVQSKLTLFYLAERFYMVVLQKLISAQIRQPILCSGDDEGWFDGSVRKSAFVKQLFKHCL